MAPVGAPAISASVRASVGAPEGISESGRSDMTDLLVLGARSGNAAELGEHVRVVGLEPVSEARADDLVGGGPGAALQHVVLAVEEVGGIALVPGDVGGETG